MAGTFQLIPTPLGLGSTPWVPGYMTLSMSSIKEPQSSVPSPDDFESHHSLLVSSIPGNYVSSLSKPGTYFTYDDNNNNNNNNIGGTYFNYNNNNDNNDNHLTSLSNSATSEKSGGNFESANFNSNLVDNSLLNISQEKGSRKSQNYQEKNSLHFLSDGFSNFDNSYGVSGFNTVSHSKSASDPNNVVSSNVVIDPFNYKPIVKSPSHPQTNQPSNSPSSQLNQKPFSQDSNSPPTASDKPPLEYLSFQNTYYVINKKPSHSPNQKPSYIPLQNSEDSWGVIDNFKVGVPSKPSYLPPGVVSQSNFPPSGPQSNLSPSVPQSYNPPGGLDSSGLKSLPRQILLLFLMPIAIPAQLLFVATGGLAFLLTGILEKIFSLSPESIGKVWIGLNFAIFAPVTIGAAVLFPGFLFYLVELFIKLAVT